MPKYNRYFTKNKPEDFVLVYNAKVLEIIELNKTYPEQYKLKTSFKCESVTGNPRVCVYWGNKIDLKAGDLVNMKGRYKKDAFIASKMQIKKECKK